MLPVFDLRFCRRKVDHQRVFLFWNVANSQTANPKWNEQGLVGSIFVFNRKKMSNSTWDTLNTPNRSTQQKQGTHFPPSRWLAIHTLTEVTNRRATQSFSVSSTASEARKGQQYPFGNMDPPSLPRWGGGTDSLNHPDHRHCRFFLPGLPQAVFLQAVLAYRYTPHQCYFEVVLIFSSTICRTCFILTPYASAVNQRPLFNLKIITSMSHWATYSYSNAFQISAQNDMTSKAPQYPQGSIILGFILPWKLLPGTVFHSSQ